MLHSRQRFISSLILKRLKVTPILAIQGARQTGKSFLVRELLAQKLPQMIYKTLDKKTDRDFAQNNPDSFLSQYLNYHPLAIDEAQKSPMLFDALKAVVDEKRRPGSYILLGSTEFSHLFKVRESLTGRMGRVRLYPFTLAESRKKSQLKPWNFSLLSSWQATTTRAELLRYLERGGMPGIFAIRENEVRTQLLQDWLEMTIQRDLLQIPRLKLSSELATNLLEQIVLLPEPSTTHLAKILKTDQRRIKTHLEALKALFVITPLSPLSDSTGKELWFLLDCAFVKLLGGSFKRLLQTWLFNEIQVQNSLSSHPFKFHFYRTSKGSIIDFVLSSEKQNVAIQIFDTESIYDRDLNLLRSFEQKYPHSIKLALSGGEQDYPQENLFVRPWEIMV